MSVLTQVVTEDMQDVAGRIQSLLGRPLVSGQVFLHFEGGRPKGAHGWPTELLAVVERLRDVFGGPLFSEEITLNFHDGVLQSVERRSSHFGSIETREYFRVRGREKALAARARE